jgi:hypothetical protein
MTMATMYATMRMPAHQARAILDVGADRLL